MLLVLSGKFESAYVRFHDETANPERNKTLHQYYLDLNRNTDTIFRHGAAVFTALSEETFIPAELDWNGSDLSERCGLKRSSAPIMDDTWNARYDAIKALLDSVEKADILSAVSERYILDLSPKGYATADQNEIIGIISTNKNSIISSYLRRLIHQIHTAGALDAYLLISEDDTRIITEIGNFLKSGKFEFQIDFPDLSGKLLDPDDFFGGILNFAPPDINSLEAVRNDKDIRAYAKRVSAEIEKGGADGMNKAAIETYVRTRTTRRVDTVFEIAKWVAKPVRYIPGANVPLALAEDAMDAVDGIEKLRNPRKDWHLIGVKMQTLAIEDFLQRKGNQ